MRFVPAKYGLLPDPLHLNSFYDLPRTLEAAVGDKWAEADGVLSGKGVSVWCRDGDYRVCLLFDSLGSVAGIQVSVRSLSGRESGAAKGNTVAKGFRLNQEPFLALCLAALREGPEGDRCPPGLQHHPRLEEADCAGRGRVLRHRIFRGSQYAVAVLNKTIERGRRVGGSNTNGVPAFRLSQARSCAVRAAT